MLEDFSSNRENIHTTQGVILLYWRWAYSCYEQYDSLFVLLCWTCSTTGSYSLNFQPEKKNNVIYTLISSCFGCLCYLVLGSWAQLGNKNNSQPSDRPSLLKLLPWKKERKGLVMILSYLWDSRLVRDGTEYVETSPWQMRFKNLKGKLGRKSLKMIISVRWTCTIINGIRVKTPGDGSVRRLSLEGGGHEAVCQRGC